MLIYNLVNFILMKESRRFQRVLIVVFLTLNASFLCSMKGFELSSILQYSMLTALIGTGMVLVFSRRQEPAKKRKKI